MHVCIINHSLPSESSNGGPMTVWGIINGLLLRGHQVSCIALKYPNDVFHSKERIQLLIDLGVELEVVDVEAYQTAGLKQIAALPKNRSFSNLYPKIWDIFPSWHCRNVVADLISKLAPDAIFAYHWDSLATTVGIQDVPVFSGVGDRWAIPLVEKWKKELIWEKLKKPKVLFQRWMYISACEKYQKQMMESCRIAGSFQAGDAERMRNSYGIRSIQYYPTPLIDPVGGDVSKINKLDQELPVFLLGPSNVNATSTHAGIEYFANEVLPVLNRLKPDFEFRLRVVGEGPLAEKLKPLLEDHRVEVCGRIEPPDQEFLTCTAQLIPTPMVFGVRVRIVAGMSYGCCIITTPHEQVNIPELKQGHNALIAGNAHQFAKSMIEVATDVEMRRKLGKNARETYEQEFSVAQAAEPVCRVIEQNCGDVGERTNR